MNIDYIEKNRIQVNRWIENYFKQFKENTSLHKAIEYGVKNGGKRLRPFFINQICKILNIPYATSKNLALGIEFIHCYSLIHDDLPAMDNDDFRRGKLTVHKKFTESTAILAGNSLYGMAIELILSNKIHKDPTVRMEVLKMILNYTGPRGLMYGQFNDLYYENKKTNTEKILTTYELKTSKLFELSTTLPFVIKGEDKKKIKNAKIFGKNFGIIYQIADDFSDSDKTFKQTGKIPGKDKKKGKQTLVNRIGRDKALKLCYKLANKSTKNIPIFGEEKYYLKKLMFNIIDDIKI